MLKLSLLGMLKKQQQQNMYKREAYTELTNPAQLRKEYRLFVLGALACWKLIKGLRLNSWFFIILYYHVFIYLCIYPYAMQILLNVMFFPLH